MSEPQAKRAALGGVVFGPNDFDVLGFKGPLHAIGWAHLRTPGNGLSRARVLKECRFMSMATGWPNAPKGITELESLSENIVTPLVYRLRDCPPRNKTVAHVRGSCRH